jgi:hypothetical protein
MYALLAVAAILSHNPARADVVEASPSGFLLRSEAVATAAPDQAYRALGQIGRWWNPAHSYSGEARRLSLDLTAGGCFCERWGRGQSVEHARVVMVTAYEGVRTIRMSGALGPLQEMGVSGILTYTLAPDPGGVKITMTYRVSGDAGLALDGLAPLVDQVLMEQSGRLVRFASGEAPG